MNTAHVVTRIPPSPTGHLHIGTARTALFNMLFARHHNGTVLFRSEDTDPTRSTREYEEEIVKGLEWLGITWDGKRTRQSERTERYRELLSMLIENGSAYISREESKKNAGEMVGVVRLKNPNTTIRFTDHIRGEVTFDTTELGDFVIARSTDDPLYHFTVVADDMDMGITHILRGEDHISNTPRQILIQEALGAPRPEYAHLPLILATDRSKLSKRHGAVSVEEYRRRGYLPEALLNYLALLGWNPGTEDEIFTLDELIEAFEIKDIQKGGAIFDIEKLDWINKKHLKTYSDEAFYTYITPALTKSLKEEEERLFRLLPEIRDRIHTHTELAEQVAKGEYAFLTNAKKIDALLYAWKKDTSVENVLPRLTHVKTLLAGASFESIESIKEAIWHYIEEEGKGEVLWPLRMALTRQQRSPDPFTVAFVLQKEETLKRIEDACDTITANAE